MQPAQIPRFVVEYFLSSGARVVMRSSTTLRTAASLVTDVLPDDPRTVCEVIAQEIAHSFGLDHEMLPADPMTYLDYNGDRTFQDRMVSCGEYADRTCGINGSTCRQRQNSVALLKERLGAHGA